MDYAVDLSGQGLPLGREVICVERNPVRGRKVSPFVGYGHPFRLLRQGRFERFVKNYARSLGTLGALTLVMRIALLNAQRIDWGPAKVIGRLVG
jgi:hypothetical protein